MNLKKIEHNNEPKISETDESEEIVENNTDADILN